jgi:hypothetical protein
MRISLRRLSLVVALFGLAVPAVMDLLLPWYVEERLPVWARELGLSGLHCEVRRIGLTGADFGPFSLGGGDGEAGLTCASLQVSYSPAGLLSRTIDSVRLSGLSLTLSRNVAGWRVRGLPFPSASEPQGAGKNKGIQLPLHIGDVRVAASMLSLADGGKTLNLPVELQARLPGPDRITGTALVSLFGEAVRLEAAVDLAAQQATVKMAADRLPLRHLAVLFDLPCDLVPAGAAGFGATLAGELAPLRVRSGTFRFLFQHPRWEAGGLAWTGSDPFTVQGTVDGGRLRMAVSPVLFKGPFSGALNLTDTLVEFSPWPHFAGRWSLGPPGGEGGLAAPLLRGGFSGEMEASGRWRFDLDGRCPVPQADRPARLALATGVTLGLKAGNLSLHGEGGQGDLRLEAAFDMKGMRAGSGADRFSLGRLVGRGHLTGAGHGLTGEAELRGERAAYTRPGVQADIPRVDLSAAFSQAPQGGWQGRGEWNLAQGVVRAAGEELRVSGLAALLPWQYPFSPPASSGHLRVAGVSHGGRSLGRIDALLRQEQDGVSWQGTWKNLLTPETDLRFTGELHPFLPAASLDFHLERRAADLRPLLTSYAPGLRTMELRSDLVRLQGHAGFAPCGLYGQAEFALDGLSFHDPETKLQGEGLSLHLVLSDLFAPRSGPAQRFSFSRIALGEVVFEQGETRFQVEPEGNLLVERLAFGWGGGKVHSESFRLRPDLKEVDVVLYCDRIQLSRILEQLGAGRAEGGGALNGRIPVHYHNGKWTFDDGFLYSTPGQGGVLHVSGMENLTTGLPEDAAVSGQIRLAEAALRDYEYRWARVGIDTDQEDLLVSLQMDGKPAGLLPFVYRRELGGFVRAEADSPGSSFQGIRLDLNFRFPLDRLMRYKNLLMIFD